jgi:hypothetical protein
MAQTTYEGMNCLAVLDTEAGTLTLTHSGMTTPKHKKDASPWVIPLGAISEVEFKEKSALARGWVRAILVDRVGYAKNQLDDTSAFFAGKQKVTEFVDAINTARAEAPPAVMTAVPGQSLVQRMEARSAAMQSRVDQAEQVRRDNPRFNGIVVRDAQWIDFNKQSFPLAGARATVDVGAPQRRTTATRIVVGSVASFGVGTMVGAMAKKTSNNVYVTVEMADGQMIVVDVDAKKERQAREFTAALNSSAARAANRATDTTTVIDAEVVDELLPAHTPVVAGAEPHLLEGPDAPDESPAPPASPPPPPPPPPPAVPAGWYPDAAQPALLLRYWDGSTWTEHTAPKPPS